MAPLPGMSVVGEYTTRFDADVAAAVLMESGLESTVLSANWAFPHDAVERSFRLVVRDEILDHASLVLADGRPPDHEADRLDAMFHHRRFGDRPQWIRWGTWAVLVALAGPLLVTAGLQALYLLDRLFPG